MKEIGADEAYKSYYQQWPLFRNFRKTDQFLREYEAIYQTQFSYQEQNEFGWKKFLDEAQELMQEEEIDVTGK